MAIIFLFSLVFFSSFFFIIMIIFLAAPCGIQDHSFPDQGSNLCSLQWKCRVLTTNLPGNSLFLRYWKRSFMTTSLANWRRQWHPTPACSPGKIPWTEEPGRLQSMGSLGVGHDWATSLSLFTFMHWRRQWQPTPVFLPGESLGWGSLVGCRLWGHTRLKRLSRSSSSLANMMQTVKPAQHDIVLMFPRKMGVPYQSSCYVFLHHITLQ